MKNPKSIDLFNKYKEEKKISKKKDKFSSLTSKAKQPKESIVGGNIPKAKTKKKPSRGKLVKKLDAIFSKYIRLAKSVKGVCVCVSCGMKGTPKEMQNGHFISRGNYKYRRNEDNCNPQCMPCNIYKSGNYMHYTLYMIQIHGHDKVRDMIEDKELIKIKTYEIEEMIEKYTQLVKELEKVNI